MNINVDNNYINKYLDEQAERNHEKTRAMHIANKKEEIPYLIAKYGGISLIILCIGFALKNANSFTKETLNQTITGEAGIVQQYSAQNEDELIDVEALLAESTGSNDEFLSEALTEELPADVVRNYVIFDQIPFDHSEITKVTVGRQYDSPGSEYSAAWCYIVRKSPTGLRDTLFLKEIDEDGIDNLNVTDQVAAEFLLSKNVILEAQSKCTI
ncbi:hypothetical protein N9333_01145 [Gammaproteobacteria bacterium]|nr:hypothetical protein [Gammaproteobacteria bacterium]